MGFFIFKLIGKLSRIFIRVLLVIFKKEVIERNFLIFLLNWYGVWELYGFFFIFFTVFSFFSLSFFFQQILFGSVVWFGLLGFVRVLSSVFVRELFDFLVLFYSVFFVFYLEIEVVQFFFIWLSGGVREVIFRNCWVLCQAC